MSQSAFVMDYLANTENINVNVHDPLVKQGNFELEMEAQGFPLQNENGGPTGTRIKFMGNDYLSAVKNTQCIVVMTECDEFKKYNFAEIRQHMGADAAIYDLRSYLDLS